MAHTLDAPPATQVEPVTEMLHGIAVTDPYRWLEDQNSPRTRTWLVEQRTYARSYFDSLSGRGAVRQAVEELLSIRSVFTPWNVGDRYLYLKLHRGAEQPAIVMRNGLLGAETTLVDPALRDSGTSTAVSIAAISDDGRYLAYSVRQGGTDHSTIEILDIERNVVLPDRLAEGFCTGIVFAADGGGFFYSHRVLNDARPNYRAAFWHEFCTEASQDREIFFAGDEPNLYLGILNSPESGLLAFPVFRTGKAPRTTVYLWRKRPDETGPKLLLEDIEGCFVPFFVRGQLLAYTDFAAHNFRIVQIDPSRPAPSDWRDIVPESDRVMQQFAVAGGQILVTRIDRFSTTIEVYDLDGNGKSAMSVPLQGSVDLVNRTNCGDLIFYTHTSISKAPSVYCYNVRSKELAPWEEVSVPFEPSLIASEEATCVSRDGARVPIFPAGRKDLIHAGPLPTFITGYGGFGSCVTPRFTAFATFLMEQGFLFVVPAIRGGAELGEDWHQAGKRGNRQNAFDDFIATVEWLLSENRSRQGCIAIGGGSNAGLLVGAAITQRPDLFRAAICLGPLLDMTRYHLFDFAAAWVDEYGSPENERDFHSLLAYSPYHNVRNELAYPSVLLISGDADTRCNPMHARKMTARLQAANVSDHPILLDYKPAWGHTPVQPLSTKIESLTDRLAFICHELQVHVQPRSSR